MQTDPYFFGYGSLVNRDTHDYAEAHRARVPGWRRVWRHTAVRDIAFLTAEPAPGLEIDGLIARVPGADWRVLDAREEAYDRVRAEIVHHEIDPAPEVSIYHIPEGKHGRPSRAHPILLSYLDVVVQGYLREFGEAGLRRFVETTGGWEAPLRDDRAVPEYPRAQRLSKGELGLVDDLVAELPLERFRA